MGFLGGILSSLLGGVSGALNPRPPSLSPTQSGALNNLIPLLQKQIGQVGIDPQQQSLLYNNIAQSQMGGMDAVTHALVSRGLGQSGLLGGALTQVVNQAQQSRNQANMGLLQQSLQQRQLGIQDLLGALNISNIPGQSAAGGFFAGMAPVAAYSIMNAMNNGGFNYGGGGSSNFTTPGGFWSGGS